MTFLTYTTMPLLGGVLGITISNLGGSWPPQSLKITVSLSCQTEVGSYIVYDIITGKTPWYRQLWLETEQNQLTCPYLYHHTFIERCHRNHYIKFGCEPTSLELKNDNFLSAAKLKLVVILSMMSQGTSRLPRMQCKSEENGAKILEFLWLH